MEPAIKVFGARATIHIFYEGDIQSLAIKLASGLMIDGFEIAPREYPPHEMIGTAETLGWELWLERVDSEYPFQYSLKMETEHSVKESYNNDMHDLSPWLARYISLVCDIDTLVSGTKIKFSRK